MKKSLLMLLLCAVCCCQAHAQYLLRGADISWCTEMEAGGYKFYNSEGTETDIFQLMKDIGMDAIRLRVWVNPENAYGNYSNKADVLAKAKRANDLGLKLMIDFHYSDFFTDPGTQTTPAAWKNYTFDEVKAAITSHTTEILQALKNEDITPVWVQVGNETNQGMVWDLGKISGAWSATTFANYATLTAAGYSAVKEIFPDATVIVHLGNTGVAEYFYQYLTVGTHYDMIGLSHYPESDWDSASTQSPGNQTTNNKSAANNVTSAISRYDVPVMICETGYYNYSSELVTEGEEVMNDLFSRLLGIQRCVGIFYWEPQLYNYWKPDYYETINWDAYGKGAFINYDISSTEAGRPSAILNAFSDKTTYPDYPSQLRIYYWDDTNGNQTVGYLTEVEGKAGVYSAQVNATTDWMWKFQLVDDDNNLWYGSNPSDASQLCSTSDKYNLWIEGSTTGYYSITADLVNMTWSYEYISATGVDNIIADGDDQPEVWYDLMGNKVLTPENGRFYIVKQGNKARKVLKR